MVKVWKVYLLWNPRINRTYIGATTDIKRRLRQHNREIVGGARSTLKGAPDWQLSRYLTGFETRSEAYRWEKLLKLRGGKGIVMRRKAFLQVGLGQCLKSKRKQKEYLVPAGLDLVVYDYGT